MNPASIVANRVQPCFAPNRRIDRAASSPIVRRAVSPRNDFTEPRGRSAGNSKGATGEANRAAHHASTAARSGLRAHRSCARAYEANAIGAGRSHGPPDRIAA